jgi:transcriptional regulator with XRE-family HTH domain
MYLQLLGTTVREESAVVIADRLRSLREEKKMSQGDIEKRTGLLRCYISRVENGHTVPAVETLEKLARAMEVPLYQLFYEGDEPAEPPKLPKNHGVGTAAWGDKGRDAKVLSLFRRYLSRTNENDQKLLLSLAHKMASQTTPKSRRKATS